MRRKSVSKKLGQLLDRCNISQIFTFFVQFQCPMSYCAFHLYNSFSGEFRTGQHGRKVGGLESWVRIIYFKILTCLISVNVFELLSSLFIMRFIIIIISIYIIIIIITIVMVIIVYYLLFVLLLLLLLSLLLLSFVLPSILFVNVCIVLYPLIFIFIIFFLCHRLKINNHIPCI